MMDVNSAYRPALERAFAHSLVHLEGLERASVSATATLAELRQALRHPLMDDGLGAAQVIDELATDVVGGVLGSAGAVSSVGSLAAQHRPRWQRIG